MQYKNIRFHKGAPNMAKNIGPLALVLTLAGVFAFSHPGLALSAKVQAGGFTGPKAYGFTGPGPAPATVEQVLCMRNESNVYMQGRILKNLGPEKYIFKDKTGIIFLEIDDSRWGEQQVSPDDVVDIYGRLGKSWTRVEVAVKRVVKR